MNEKLAKVSYKSSNCMLGEAARVFSAAEDMWEVMGMSSGGGSLGGGGNPPGWGGAGGCGGSLNEAL